MALKGVSLLIATGLLLLSTYAAAHPVNIEEEAVADEIAEEDDHYWEKSGYFEGDIVFPESQFRNGRLSRGKPARFRSTTIPVAFDPGLDAKQRDAIRKAFAEYHQKTCIRFKEIDGKDRKEDHIYIGGNKPGCFSAVGRMGGRQYLNLRKSRAGTGCFSHGVILHELLHSLGFHHQQSASERDDYVTINWDNIQKGNEHNFRKYNKNQVTSFGVEYDYGSIMHYGSRAFSRNGKPTIVPKKSGVTIGQRSKGLSAKDVKKLNLMYNCPAHEYNAEDAETDLEDFLTHTE